MSDQKKLNDQIDRGGPTWGNGWWHEEDGEILHKCGRVLLARGWKWEEAADFISTIACAVANEYGH